MRKEQRAARTRRCTGPTSRPLGRRTRGVSTPSPSAPVRSSRTDSGPDPLPNARPANGGSDTHADAIQTGGARIVVPGPGGVPHRLSESGLPWRTVAVGPAPAAPPAAPAPPPPAPPGTCAPSRGRCAGAGTRAAARRRGSAPGARTRAATAARGVHAERGAQGRLLRLRQVDIRPGDAKILDASATYLKANPNQLVLIEGHCDERGTIEYNLALGERRAKAAMNYLVARRASTRAGSR